MTAAFGLQGFGCDLESLAELPLDSLIFQMRLSPAAPLLLQPLFLLLHRLEHAACYQHSLGLLDGLVESYQGPGFNYLPLDHQ